MASSRRSHGDSVDAASARARVPVNQQQRPAAQQRWPWSARGGGRVAAVQVGSNGAGGLGAQHKGRVCTGAAVRAVHVAARWQTSSIGDRAQAMPCAVHAF